MLLSNDNVDTGHMNSTDQTLAVQTPAVDFILMNQTVSLFLVVVLCFWYMYVCMFCMVELTNQ